MAQEALRDGSEEFQKAANDVKALKDAKAADLLELYKYYKQTRFGPAGPKTGWLPDMGKHESWKSLGDMPWEEAQEKYIQTVKELIEKYGTS
ncbi:acyl-CoA-binding protein [Geopyxis carbonaria]|nr:acyl-CoA-binding protein [Geopyxis carbonaria]